MPQLSSWSEKQQALLEWLAPGGPAVDGWQALVEAVRAALPILLVVWLIVVVRRYWQALVEGPQRFAHFHSDKSANPCDKSGEGLSTRKMRSAGRTYRLVRKLAAGDVGDVYLAKSDCGRHVMKVARAAVGDTLLAKEHTVLETLLGGSRDDDLYYEYYPWPEECFRAGRRLATAFAWREGFFSALEIRHCHPVGVDGRHLAWMFHRMLEALGHAHAHGFVHGAVLPPHLLFHVANHGLQLIDWTSAERLGSRLQAAPQQYLDWYPPECHQRRGATAATDIYLAAKCLVWLAGGDPRAGSMPPHVPRPLAELVEHALASSPRSRPQDAWQLHAQLTVLLEEVYGPPQFHDLVMT